MTLHHPAKPRGDTTLLPSGEAALPRAYELDDAPRFERFFFVTDPDPSASHLDSSRVIEAAEALAKDPRLAKTAPMSLPEFLEQTSTWVVKESPTKEQAP